MIIGENMPLIVDEKTAPEGFGLEFARDVSKESLEEFIAKILPKLAPGPEQFFGAYRPRARKPPLKAPPTACGGEQVVFRNVSVA
jgi:hypothetical protein